MFRQEEERANDSWIIKLICIVARYDGRGREKRQGMAEGEGPGQRGCYRGRGIEEKKPSRFPPGRRWGSGEGEE